uniref:uncharacterized protein LOC104266582 n=1 Tax=Ciona intestinalis TaxID=7719 RepID=UPI000521372D|nr:uncharacterized protein LOC104266582 [Ciona intestinalis]|eukprot:XP_009861444.1 uncharacterized protein LOC104266582 [Ciona intestinalis]
MLVTIAFLFMVLFAVQSTNSFECIKLGLQLGNRGRPGKVIPQKSNHTEVCKDQNICYATWKHDGKRLKLLTQGCLPRTEIQPRNKFYCGSSTCGEANPKSCKQDLSAFCCCNKTMCNFEVVPNSCRSTQSNTKHTVTANNDDQQIVILKAVVIICILVLSQIIVFVFIHFILEVTCYDIRNSAIKFVASLASFSCAAEPDSDNTDGSQNFNLDSV